MTRDADAEPNDRRDSEPTAPDDADRSLGRASRRGVLAVGATGLLAGCLVTSEEESVDGEAAGQTDDESGGEDGSDAEGEGSDGDAGSGEDGADDAPDEVGPDGSGLLVTEATVLDVTKSGGRTTVEARLTVENAGRFDYGFVKLRVDAYATPAGSDEREAVGFGDATRRFSPDNRFDGSRSRRFTAEITFPSRRSNARADPDNYAVDAAVRRAEPL
ncbi:MULTISPECIES: hypothetical protein [Halorubrum]|uniref:Uncharacterized protein n=1 Tax=Halorubrum hochstenium ATCC 700873 TaxID=1227481 RepID=M0FBB2_9EURY|nr:MULTISPECIES: hypothetical protein [Halorubrum]ELZ57245.1 hypothetical protein C467_06828 [Halorubrum hochstenium ATCC 700873]